MRCTECCLPLLSFFLTISSASTCSVFNDVYWLCQCGFRFVKMAAIYNQENDHEWNTFRLREDEEMDFFTDLAVHECERWIQAVTKKKFTHADDFRRSLANGILLCQLLNNLKPGSVKRINKLPGTISGLDNINVFLLACQQNFNLSKTHLFDPSDLEDLSQRAISDQDEHLLKQEVDRRARNVAITIYWLGRSVSGTFSGPALDVSAFSALIHSYKTKDVISEECFKNYGVPLMKDIGNLNTNQTKLNHKHIRDSSCDSLGSYEHESNSSFDDLDAGSSNMPARSDMREMRRYGSASSLSMTRDLRLSTASGDSVYSDDKQDMYQSSPDLSQESQAHTRSSSTDSADGSYYGSHSRQSSGSVDCPRLTTGGLRRPTTTTPLMTDPLQFVKIKSAHDLAIQAKKQMQIAQEVNKMRISVDSGVGLSTNEPDWQSNFQNWKTKRRKSGFANVANDLQNSGEEESEGRKSHKTYSEIILKKEKGCSLASMNLYPTEDDDSGLGEVKAQDEPIIKSHHSSNTESQPKCKKAPAVAPWARDSSGEDNSQSDSETNQSQQSGDTDSVFSDKSTPSKILSDDDSWVKSKPNVAKLNKSSPFIQKPKSLGDNVKLWEENATDSHRKESSGEKMDVSITGGKIKNIKQTFEPKEKVAPELPAGQRQSEYRLRQSSLQSRGSQDSYDDNSPRHPSQNNKELMSPTSARAFLLMEQNSPPTNVSQPMDNSNKKFTELQIKISQKPNNNKGFGFILVGGAEKKRPITVQRVALGSAADVCEVQVNDEILSVNARNVSSLTLAQVQGIVEHSLKRGTIDLSLRRYSSEGDNDVFSSIPSNNDGNFKNQSRPDDNISASLKSDLPVPAKAEDTAKPRIMDQLLAEKQRETNVIEKAPTKAPSPILDQQIRSEVTLHSYTLPSRHTSEKTQYDTALQHTPNNDHDLSAPVETTVTEEKPKLSVKRSPMMSSTDKEPSSVQTRLHRTPTNRDTSPLSHPPNAEAPSSAQSPDGSISDDSNFGPPAALLRWQRPKSKSEYISVQVTTEQNERPNRYNVTVPLSSENVSPPLEDDKCDPFDKLSKDFAESLSISDMPENKSKLRQFNDTKHIEEWHQKQDQQRMLEVQPTQTLSIHRDEKLTPQPASSMQIDAPHTLTLESSQEKFEKEQQHIRQQYEEEKKRVREAEKQKQDKEQPDKFLCVMESQTLKTTKEAVDFNLPNFQPTTMTTTMEQRFNSEPLTIKLSSGSPGRTLIIDPRNQRDESQKNRGDMIDSVLPEYSFHLDLVKSESAPSLSILNQKPELSQVELLARERERIREEEKQRLEEEQKQWKEEQEKKLKDEQDKIRQERAQLQMEQEHMQREKALLEQKKSYEYQSVNNNLHVFTSLKNSTSGASSSVSPPISPISTLEQKVCEKKTPPPTAPKPDKSRLTREDLLVMNRKPTPLTNRPENVEDDSLNETPTPTIRETLSKGELSTQNAVPQQKFRNSTAWIKEEDAQNLQNEKPFVIGRRSDLIHKDNSNNTDHWVVQEAERRRLAEQTEHANARHENIDSTTAHLGPTKHSQSSVECRFRGDTEPPSHSNHRFSFPSSNIADSRLSSVATHSLTASGSRSRLYERNVDAGVTQFSAKTHPGNYLSNVSVLQTLPSNASLSTNSRHYDSSAKVPRSLTEEQEPVIAVSGKQKCSHCAEELGFGAAMVIESLGLYYHVQCFRCCVCRTTLGNGSEGTDVRVRVNKLHCKNCYSNDEAGLKFSKV